MTEKEILEANNQLLAAICNNLQIPIEEFPNYRASIGGGGISRPTNN